MRALRQHLAAHHARFRALVESPVFLRTAGPVSGDTLKRVPPGFPADHPAAEYLRLRQFLFGREYPAAFAATPGFYRRMLSLFERMAPVVRFLNEPLTAAAGRRDPLAADPRDAHTRARTTRR